MLYVLRFMLHVSCICCGGRTRLAIRHGARLDNLANLLNALWLFCFLESFFVAGAGLEPATSRLWASQATIAPPRDKPTDFNDLGSFFITRKCEKDNFCDLP